MPIRTDLDINSQFIVYNPIHKSTDVVILDIWSALLSRPIGSYFASLELTWILIGCSFICPLMFVTPLHAPHL